MHLSAFRPENSAEYPPSIESSEVFNWPKHEIGNTDWDREHSGLAAFSTIEPKGCGAASGGKGTSGCVSDCGHRLNNMFSSKLSYGNVTWVSRQYRYHDGHKRYRYKQRGMVPRPN
ncbi:epoxide hydrolase [Moniliophthora roreri]|nr:epoxide hydrolase [Moniliophthora roreri]